MNLRFLKWTVIFFTFFGLMFAAAGVAAKKPGGDQPPGPSDDPCATMATFTPDFVFWRDTGNRKNPQVTIFLAESTNGCEKKLVDVSLKDSYRIQNLKFSSVEDEGGFFGRVVWTNVVIIVSRQDAFVWKMDFRINGANLAFLDDRPVEVLRNGSLDDPNVSETIFWSLDLSPDTGSLVYAHLVKENDLYNQYLRILPDIDECVSVNDTDPCSFYAGEVLDQTGDAPSSSKGPLFTFSSWGPNGESIFVQRRIPDPDAPFGSYNVIQYYDLLSQVGEAHQLFSDLPFIARPVSGMVDNTQYLAVEKEFSEKTGGCEGIFITEFENCLASEEDCFTIPVIAGKFPSWTKDGKLIHAYDGWAPHGGCGLSAVGVYDPSEGSLKSILDGQEPDAASN